MSCGLSPAQALEKLKEGNQRVISGNAQPRHAGSATELEQHTGGQSPFAIVLACSDSRVPVELVFDQGLGDLFVIRVAGNIAAPSQVGSAEYAAAVLGSPLLVVLGHSSCGAIQATIDLIANDDHALSDNLLTIVQRIRPGIESLVKADHDPDSLTAKAVTANIVTTVQHLQDSSEILSERISAGELEIVGAEYDLATGQVEFL